jgi:hypothetical protein
MHLTEMAGSYLLALLLNVMLPSFGMAQSHQENRSRVIGISTFTCFVVATATNSVRIGIVPDPK